MTYGNGTHDHTLSIVPCPKRKSASAQRSRACAIRIFTASARMRSEGTVVGFVCLSVCLSVLKPACSKFILTHNKGVKFCGISSEASLLQSYSPCTATTRVGLH